MTTSDAAASASDPFDDPHARYHALINADGQHSLQPDFAGIPADRAVVLGPENRESCFAYIESNWDDLRPTCLIAVMSQDAAA